MSRIPLLKYEQVIISGQQSTVPPGWGRLFASELPITLEILSVIDRARYQALGTQPPVNGEVWTFRTGNSSIPHKVTSGYLQLFVQSGSLEVTKNGQSFSVKTGEKVNFQPGDVFTVQGCPATMAVVRNESALLAPGSHPQKGTPSLALSQHVVDTVRAQLGLTSEAPHQRRARYDGERSSAAYRGRPRY